MLASLERYAEAESYFAAVLRAEPGNAAAHFNLGYTYDKRGLYAKAIAAFGEATRLNPKIDRAWYGMGLAHAQLGQHEEAARGAARGRHAAADEPARLVPAGHGATIRCATPKRWTKWSMHLLRFDPRMTRRLILDAGRSDLAHLVKDLVV